MKRVKRTLRFSRLWASTLFASLLGLANPGHVHSAGLPMGGQIVSGTGQIGSVNAQALTVTQSSPKMIVDWASFNVGAGSTVTFVQPGSSSVALNRVTGPDPSTIQGSIRANGQVFLVNPNGVYFTPGSQISVGALVASTLKISNEDFNSGRYRFEGNSTAQLINEGSITATGDGTNSGAAYFIAARVINRGSIDAPHGKVGLASGRKVMLDIGAPVPLQIDESAIDGLIEQSGIIKADGGQIMITSKAASALHASVINQTGTLQATSLGIGQNGEIILSAGENGTANISGTLNVSSPDNQAGRVEVTAQKITIKDGARIDATGQTGGGTVLIGGDWQGSGATQQAKTVSVEPDVEIDASAKSLGDGGKVVVWSDIRDPESITSVSGSLKSEGGSIQGNGGMIETSGHALQVDGIRISTQAPNGKTGLWLLDPYNIEISSSPGSTTITPATSGSPANTAYTAGGDTSVVFVGDLHDALANNNVTVFTGNSGLQNGDITVNSPISFSSGHLLTLEAARNVVLNNTVTLTNGSDLTISAGGGLSGASGVSLASGSALIVEQAGTSTYSGVISGAGSITKSGTGALALSGANTYTGATTVSAGTLSIGSGGTTGSVMSMSIANSGLVEFNRSNDLTYSGVISGTGALTKLGGGTLTLTGANNYSGASTITAGTLSIGNGGTTGSIASTTINNNGLLTFNRLDDLTYSGVISGTGALTKLGAGTLTLSGNNTYSGTSTITAGTLSIGNGGTAGSIASTTINNNGLLTFNRLDDLTYSGVISGTGGLSKLGAGVLYLTGTNDYSGTSTITEGTLSIGNGGASGSINSAAINNSGTLIFNRTNNSTYGGTISGTGTLTKLGTGTLYFTGENDYGGVSTITAGTLSIGDGGTTGSISNSSISNSGSLHFNRSNNSTYSGVISGTGTLTKLGAGTLYLTGANTYSGTSSITAGTLSLGDGGATGSIASTTISNNGSLEFNRSNDLTYSGVISGTGSLSKRGTGALTLSGANTFDGATTISEGMLVASHNSALGSAAGGTTIQSGATLQISNGTTISTENLTLNGSGVSASSGALVLSNTGNYSSSEITLASDSKILINGSATDPAVVLGAISGPSNSLTVDIPSGRQVSQSAAANLDKLAFTGSSGVVNFSNASNTVSTIAADTGTLTYINSTSLTIGTVNPSGITATGPVSITTTSGDLTVSAPIAASDTISLSSTSGNLIVGASITTSNASATAIVLNSGTASAAGTETGGDIQVASNASIGSSGGGRTTLYTGSVAGSSGINNVVSYGSGNFRYNADEASVAPAGIAAGTSGAYAIYRERPTISVQADDKTKIFDYIAFPAAQLTSTCTGCANGDLPVITYTGIAGNGNAIYIGAYPITATYDATYLGNVGYRVVGSEVTPGTLNIIPFPGYIPPPRETVERTSQIPIRYLIENMQPTQLKIVLADQPSLVSLFTPTTAKGNIRLAYQDGTAYREDIRLREGIIRDTIFFDAGKPSLSNEATRTLDSLLRTANRYNLSAVEVVGHTELPNSPDDALKLSEERAKVVSEYLQNRWSLDKRPAKITSLGRSYLQPISDNITYSGRARNRRTEVTITGVYLE